MTNTKTVKTSKSLVGKSGTDWSEAPEGTIGIDGRYDVWVKNNYSWWNFEDQGWCVGRNPDWGTSRYIMKDDDLQEVYDNTQDVNDDSQDNKEDTTGKFYTEMTITYANGKTYTVKGLRVDEDVVSVDFGKIQSNKETDVRKDWSTEEWIFNTGDFKPGTTWGQKFEWLRSNAATLHFYPCARKNYELSIEYTKNCISCCIIKQPHPALKILLETEKAKREARDSARKAKKKHKANKKKPIPELTSIKPNMDGVIIADKLKSGYPLTQEEMQILATLVLVLLGGR